MKHKILMLFLLISKALIASDFKIDTISIESKILSENRTILLFTPQGFKDSDSVSIIYMLDGEYAENRMNQIAIDNNSIIGVGIVNTDRRRDLLPVYHANYFNAFIRDELFEIVERDLLIKERILYGHSFGGAFAIFSMINNPSQFEKYIASSPTPIKSLIDVELYKQLNDKLITDIKFYISYGSKDMRQVKKWASRLIDNLLKIELDNIHWTSEIYDGENHNTSDKISIVNGLKY